MRRAILATLVATTTAAVACRSLLGLHDPIAEADDAGAQDAHAGPDVDNGEPSDAYPAPHQPLPQIVRSPNGEVIDLPTVRCIAFAGDSLAAALFPLGAGWLQSDLWQQQAFDYGVGAATAAPLVTVSEPAPTTITAAQIQSWLAAMLDGTHPELGPVDPDSLLKDVFVVFYPANTAVTAPAGTSCQQFTGYHGELPVGTGHTTYVVVPRCADSASAFGAATSYQILAAVTNPRPLQPAWASFDQDDLAWNFLNGDGEVPQRSEVPQPCKGLLLFPGDSGAALARSWSNVAAMESHDPCLPTPDSGAYFASSPVLTDLVSPPGAYATQGVKIGVGQHETIEVQLWSDGPTSGPWTVDAKVIPPFAEGGLSFTFDRQSGQNGEKLHLTITAMQAGVFPFLLTSTLGSKQTVWVGIVGQE